MLFKDEHCYPLHPEMALYRAKPFPPNCKDIIRHLKHEKQSCDTPPERQGQRDVRAVSPRREDNSQEDLLTAVGADPELSRGGAKKSKKRARK